MLAGEYRVGLAVEFGLQVVVQLLDGERGEAVEGARMRPAAVVSPARAARSRSRAWRRR